jgi:acylphosphatase
VKRVRVTVRGRVQGVGFRAAAAHEARRLGLAGWVRNLFDGAVELVAEGDSSVVDPMVAWLRHGPRTAKVTAVDVDESQPPAGLEGFTIRA